MGQVPPKYFMPSAPYGSSDAVNALNQAQPAAVNPQSPILPNNFTNPGTGATAGTQNTAQSIRQPVQNPFGAPNNPFKGMFGL